ncbi:hypothetical protein [Winogradskyella sediminis]|uniref:Uncharacterized protein n=1 Tax=Winogradskyella sediminis TaxID=1382466 RepID=A0A1H1QYK5_9FLAO|nr:hypothetical protein [Winogradskyella sediminis]REG89667.1 hypothetical protein C8N41_101909 [Winogradskyella sediminis]SDS28463.1 hypothetical protein SAMN04489797_1267 [Winogradskyella sediminis]
MNSSKLFTLKEARLGNNCPECYSNDSLELTFKQKLIETKLYKAITGETTCQLLCLNCEVQIFPIRWTDDIERVVDYHKRGLKIKPKSTKLKPIAWGFIAFAIIILIAVVLFVLGIF